MRHFSGHRFSRWLSHGLLLLFLPAGYVSAATPAGKRVKESPEWFQAEEGRQVIANVLAWQSKQGSWPKNTDTTAACSPEKRKKEIHGTFDNGATTGELRLLAAAILVDDSDKNRLKAFNRGLDHLFEAQYPNGGWPQSFPPGKKYHRYITYNDKTMIRLMELLQDVGESPDFRFVDQPRRETARRALDRGIDCLLKTQIVVDGKRTVWCAQHDEKTLEPRPARSYELASLSGSESAGIVRFLMELEDPTPAVSEAITGAARWFSKAAITGIRIAKIDGNRTSIADPEAPPVWARFYDLKTGRPFFCGRDGQTDRRAGHVSLA